MPAELPLQWGGARTRLSSHRMKPNSIHPNRRIRFPGKGPWLFCWALAAALLYPVSADATGVENLAKQLPGEVRLFRVADCPAFCIMPLKEKALPGPGPWIWYAPTFLAAHPDASHTWMFRQFLDHGIAIAGVEVGESYGSPKGRKRCMLRVYGIGFGGLEVYQPGAIPGL